MFTHSALWQAIDTLADHHGYSVSGLAKAAGLDPTTFNKSKRSSAGKARWPSTESIAKILTLTGCTLFDLAALVHHSAPITSAQQTLPLIRLDHAQAEGVFQDQGFPLPNSPLWDAVTIPSLDSGAYILEVVGDLFSPRYPDGTRLLLQPSEATNESELRRGDHLVIMREDHSLLLCELLRQSALRLSVQPLERPQSSTEIDLEVRSVRWAARVIWASR